MCPLNNPDKTSLTKVYTMCGKQIAYSALTLLVSVLVSLAFAEGILAALGKYDDLVNHKLVPSDALWEPLADAIDVFDHPDITAKIDNRFDSDGVRNSDAVTTSGRTNIIGFFGDSYTQNRRVREDWTFTKILQNEIAARDWSIVNFGVAGYGLDQSYIRYEKYAKFDLKHVFFVFFGNDFVNLYETGLVHLDNGVIRFQTPSPNPWRRLLGRFRLTYLTIESYLRLSHWISFAGQRVAFRATADTDGLSALAGPNGSSVAKVTSEDGAGKLIQISGVSADTPPFGKPGIYLQLPEAIENAMSGGEVKVTVLARKPTGSTSASFAVVYSTNEVGNSGWRRFALTSELQPYSFTYQVGKMRTGSGDFIGFLPSPVDGNGAVQIASIAVERVGSYATGAQRNFVEKSDADALYSANRARVKEIRDSSDTLGIKTSTAGDRNPLDILGEDFLSESPGARAIEIAATFMGVLDHWRQVAASRGQAFTVVVMPYEKTVALAKKMGFETRFDTVYLADLMGVCEKQCNFERDPHWNEFTNVRVAVALAEASQIASYRREGLDLADITERYDAKISAFYSSFPSRGTVNLSAPNP
jgi:hypothetical protein